MAAKILSAQPLVDQIKIDLKKRCDHLKSKGVTPSMVVILVGNNPASLSYIKHKKKMCEEVGANFELVQLPEDISEKDFLDKVKSLNNDSTVNGIIIQLPVSEHLKHLNLSELVPSNKDIDGFCAQNTQKIYSGTKDLTYLLPCTPKGIINLLQFYQIEIEGKNIVVIGRSLIVGKPLAMLLTNYNATVTQAHSKTEGLEKLTQNADIVISAVGKAHLLTKDHFNPNKKTVVVDVGMNTLDGKLIGDAATDISEVVAAYTPVPGGVGPMTVISLIQNLITATENQVKG